MITRTVSDELSRSIRGRSRSGRQPAEAEAASRGRSGEQTPAQPVEAEADGSKQELRPKRFNSRPTLARRLLIAEPA